jgi:hypothetical protein
MVSGVSQNLEQSGNLSADQKIDSASEQNNESQNPLSQIAEFNHKLK